MVTTLLDAPSEDPGLTRRERRKLEVRQRIVEASKVLFATQGIEAVENRTMAGKVMVYPELHEVGLIPLTELKNHYPSVAEKLAALEVSEPQSLVTIQLYSPSSNAAVLAIA